MTSAILQRPGKRPILRFERHLARPLADVWHAVTDPQAMRAWFPTHIAIDEWKVGAVLQHTFDQPGIDPLPGTVLAWDPPHRVSFTWGTDTITFELRPAAGGGTDFVLTEELGANIAARNAAGWEVCLERLASGTSPDDWKARFEHYVAVFEPELGPQDGPPDGHQDATD
jgi:uncharacterized protein YndB with AHSA1/START domain